VVQLAPVDGDAPVVLLAVQQAAEVGTVGEALRTVDGGEVAVAQVVACAAIIVGYRCISNLC
jgi:hypothetical protein